jgi:hypothetical protein
MGSLNTMAPRWNEHASCRFSYGDDFCTQIKFSTENYAAKTSRPAALRPGEEHRLTEDDATNGTYGTEQVNLLANAAITTSSEQAGFEGYR